MFIYAGLVISLVNELKSAVKTGDLNGYRKFLINGAIGTLVAMFIDFTSSYVLLICLWSFTSLDGIANLFYDILNELYHGVEPPILFFNGRMMKIDGLRVLVDLDNEEVHPYLFGYQVYKPHETPVENTVRLHGVVRDLIACENG